MKVFKKAEIQEIVMKILLEINQCLFLERQLINYG